MISKTDTSFLTAGRALMIGDNHSRKIVCKRTTKYLLFRGSKHSAIPV